MIAEDSPDPADGAAEVPVGQKDPQAFRTIGEVAKALGIRQHVLRYWEEQFPMLRPLTRAGGRRYYRPEDVALIAEIDRLLHQEGYTIKGARQALRSRKTRTSVSKQATPLVAPAAFPVAEIEAPSILEALEGIRGRLAAAIED